MVKKFAHSLSIEFRWFYYSRWIKVGIKTRYLSYHTRLMVNEQQFKKIPKHIYVGTKLLASSLINDAGKMIKMFGLMLKYIDGFHMVI